jgi:hypothetical protein
MFLAEGCNQIDCGSCDARFCWVCLELNPKRDHWNRGKQCPKYKQPGDPNASWIDPEADHQMDVENPEITLPVELFQYVPPAPSDWVLEALAVLAWLPLNIEERHLLPPTAQEVHSLRTRYIPQSQIDDPEMQHDSCRNIRDHHRFLIEKAKFRALAKGDGLQRDDPNVPDLGRTSFS